MGHLLRGSFVLTALLTSASLVHAATLKVEETMELFVPPAKVWATIGNFGSLAWHPVVAGTEITRGRNNATGAVRTITTKDGAKIVEALEARNNGRRSLRYRIVESPLPVTGYVSTLSVAPHGKGSRVTWMSNFERNQKAEGVDDAKAKEIIAGIYKAGFDGLRGQFADGAK